jgi:hypothetical protein
MPAGESVRLTENFLPQKEMSDALEVKQKDLWRWAADRVTPWGKPEKKDYDFRSWTLDASKELLRAGCIYENARESWRLRSLLVLTPAALEKARAATGLEFLSLSFDGVALLRRTSPTRRLVRVAPQFHRRPGE